MMAKKQARKQGQARTKMVAKGQQSSKQPPQALLDDVQKLFVKHDWSGNLVGRSLAATGDIVCPPGTTPHEITYQLPDGTWVTKTVCLPNSTMGAVSLPGDPGAQDPCEAVPEALPYRESHEEMNEAGLAGDSGKQDDD